MHLQHTARVWTWGSCMGMRAEGVAESDVLEEAALEVQQGVQSVLVVPNGCLCCDIVRKMINLSVRRLLTFRSSC